MEIIIIFLVGKITNMSDLFTVWPSKICHGFIALFLFKLQKKYT